MILLFDLQKIKTSSFSIITRFLLLKVEIVLVTNYYVLGFIKVKNEKKNNSFTVYLIVMIYYCTCKNIMLLNAIYILEEGNSFFHNKNTLL